MDLKRMEYNLKGYAYHYTGNRGKEVGPHFGEFQLKMVSTGLF